jgi:hypothetical protein
MTAALRTTSIAIAFLALTIVPGKAQVPYYELRGSISGVDTLRTWYSARGLLDADAGNTGAMLRHFNLHGDWDREKVRFVYKCESDLLGAPQEWGADQCPAVTDQGGIRRFSIQLAGSEAGTYDLTYSCWVAQEGHTATGRGTREPGEWCGIDHSDENVRVTRILISLRKKAPPIVQGATR